MFNWSDIIPASFLSLWVLSYIVPIFSKKVISFNLEICLIKFFALSICQKNLASARRAKMTLLFPSLITFWVSGLLVTIKKLLVNLFFESNKGKYLWCLCSVEMMISLGMSKYSLSKSAEITLGFSVILATSSINFSLKFSR